MGATNNSFPSQSVRARRIWSSFQMPYMCTLGAICILCGPLLAADTSLRWFLSTPWIHTPLDSDGIALVAHVPVSSQKVSEPGIVSRWSNPGFDTPRAQSNRGIPIPFLHCQVPLTRESHLQFSYQPQAQFLWRREQENAPIAQSDSSAAQSFAMQGWANSSAEVEARWSVLRMTYALRIAEWADLALAIEQHRASIQAEGRANGNLNMQWTIPDEESGNVPFDPSLYHSDWSGRYEGSTWSAGISARIGRFLYQGQMGIELNMHGDFSLQQTIPFFLDSLTLEPVEQSAETWVEPENRDRILAQDHKIQSFETSAPVRLRVPQAHRVGIILQDWLTMDYTYWAGHFRTSAQPAASPSRLDLRQLAAYDINLNHLTLLHLQSKWFLADAGSFWIHERVEPVASMTAILPFHPVSWSIQFDALPWIRLFCGVAYAL